MGDMSEETRDWFDRQIAAGRINFDTLSWPVPDGYYDDNGQWVNNCGDGFWNVLVPAKWSIGVIPGPFEDLVNWLMARKSAMTAFGDGETCMAMRFVTVTDEGDSMHLVFVQH